MSFDELREIEELLRKIQEKEKREAKKEPEKNEKKETGKTKEEEKKEPGKSRGPSRENRETKKRAQQVFFSKIKTSFSISDFDGVEREYDNLRDIDKLYNYASKRGFRKPSIFSKERRDRFSEYNKNKRRLEMILQYPSRPFSDSERRKICKLIKFFGLEGKYGGYCWHIWKKEKEIEKKIREWEKIKRSRNQ